MKIKSLLLPIASLTLTSLAAFAQDAPQRNEPKAATELDLLKRNAPADRIKKMQQRSAEADANPWRIGVMVNPIDDSLRSHLDLLENAGVIVTECVETFPAANAGIQKNDIIVMANGRPVNALPSLRDAVQESAKSGEPLRLSTLRKGQRREVMIKPEMPKPDGKPKDVSAPSMPPTDAAAMREQEKMMRRMAEENARLMGRVEALENMMKRLQNRDEKRIPFAQDAQREQEKMMRGMAEQIRPLMGRMESLEIMTKRLQQMEEQMKKAKSEMKNEGEKKDS